MALILKMMIHVESAVSKKKLSTTSYGLPSTKYLERHDNVCKYNHVLLLLEHGFIEKYIPWYHHQPAQVTENNSTKPLWTFSIQTDHEVINKKPDIIVVESTNKTANLVEVAVLVTVPNDCNI